MLRISQLISRTWRMTRISDGKLIKVPPRKDAMMLKGVLFGLKGSQRSRPYNDIIVGVWVKMWTVDH